MTTGRINQIAFLLKDLHPLKVLSQGSKLVLLLIYDNISSNPQKKPTKVQSATAHAGRGFAKASIARRPRIKS
jgi:hypothetical protein